MELLTAVVSQLCPVAVAPSRIFPLWAPTRSFGLLLRTIPIPHGPGKSATFTLLCGGMTTLGVMLYLVGA